jgi:signal transduction histidine kinase
MSTTDLTLALQETSNDEALARHLLVVWPVVESILDAFSKATELPIFVFLNDKLVFRSPLVTMPTLCQKMLGSPDTELLCVADGSRRAKKDEPEISEGVQLCHAGMVNGRKEIETGIGTMVVLFGSKKSDSSEAIERRQKLIEKSKRFSPTISDDLRKASVEKTTSDSIDDRDIGLMDAISDILEQLFSATVGFRSLTINMAHELSVMMLAMGLLTGELGDDMRELQSFLTGDQLKDIPNTPALIYAQCRLGLYIVRNFLSHASETRYSEVVSPRFRVINLKDILEEMIELHRLSALRKGVLIDYEELDELPEFVGSDMEIRRLFHNVLNNAIKYSYHSVPSAQRTIRIRSKVPYDPGFRRQRFSIVFENYGLGLAEEEMKKVFQPGFRGQQAVAEVPIGAGIGLSEAIKIVKAHYGEIKLSSKKLFQDHNRTTYLTSIEVIFPYALEYRRLLRERLLNET